LNNKEKDEDSNVINTNVSERNLWDKEKYKKLISRNMGQICSNR
jgi:hypothetical protein